MAAVAVMHVLRSPWAAGRWGDALRGVKDGPFISEKPCLTVCKKPCFDVSQAAVDVAWPSAFWHKCEGAPTAGGAAAAASRCQAAPVIPWSCGHQQFGSNLNSKRTRTPGGRGGGGGIRLSGGGGDPMDFGRGAAAGAASAAGLSFSFGAAAAAAAFCARRARSCSLVCRHMEDNTSDLGMSAICTCAERYCCMCNGTCCPIEPALTSCNICNAVSNSVAGAVRRWQRDLPAMSATQWPPCSMPFWCLTGAAEGPPRCAFLAANIAFKSDMVFARWCAACALMRCLCAIAVRTALLPLSQHCRSLQPGRLCLDISTRDDWRRETSAGFVRLVPTASPTNGPN